MNLEEQEEADFVARAEQAIQYILDTEGSRPDFDIPEVRRRVCDRIVSAMRWAQSR